MYKNIRKPLLIVSLVLAIGVVSMLSAYSSFAYTVGPVPDSKCSSGWSIHGYCLPGKP